MHSSRMRTGRSSSLQPGGSLLGTNPHTRDQKQTPPPGQKADPPPGTKADTLQDQKQTPPGPPRVQNHRHEKKHNLGYNFVADSNKIVGWVPSTTVANLGRGVCLGGMSAQEMSTLGVCATPVDRQTSVKT